jgi:hypothetical protein
MQTLVDSFDEVVHGRLHVGGGGLDNIARLVHHGGVAHVGLLKEGRIVDVRDAVGIVLRLHHLHSSTH